MEDAEIVLMFSLLMIPAAIWLQLWVKNRREILEGTAIVGGLIMIIMGSSGVLKYVLNFYGT
ncbi:MAG: hypothetical protein EBU46_08595 [Nitrosomonadaceae bacterium]|nr:hypothetical protein [Nitrosomonadaceae bacterium]